MEDHTFTQPAFLSKTQLYHLLYSYKHCPASKNQVPTSPCQCSYCTSGDRMGNGDHQAEKSNVEGSLLPSTFEKKHPGNQSCGVCLGMLPMVGLSSSFLDREDSHHQGCCYVKGPLYVRYCPGGREKAANNCYKTTSAPLTPILHSSPCHRCLDIALKSYSFGVNRADAAPGHGYH